MFLRNAPEEKIEDHEKRLQELLIQIEQLDQSSEEFLQELQVTPEQLTQFISNSAHFTEEVWNTLTEQKKALDEKIEKQISTIQNPLKTKQTFKNLNIPNNWVYVK